MRAGRGGAAAAVLMLLLVGCGGGGERPPQMLPPPTTTPTTDPSAEREELIRKSQAAYLIAFEQFDRLAWEGGADQPSQQMLEVAQDKALAQYVFLLQQQKKAGFRLEGERSTTRSRAAVGALKADSDPRLTLQVCENRRGSKAVYRDGRTEPSRLSSGYAYAKIVNGRVKLVDIETKEVQRCSW